MAAKSSSFTADLLIDGVKYNVTGRKRSDGVVPGKALCGSVFKDGKEFALLYAVEDPNQATTTPPRPVTGNPSESGNSA